MSEMPYLEMLVSVLAAGTFHLTLITSRPAQTPVHRRRSLLVIRVRSRHDTRGGGEEAREK